LPAAGVIGSSIQAAADTITLTFDGSVLPADGTWSSNEFSAVASPDGTAKTLSGATFSPTSGSTNTLTITLAESATDTTTYLVNGNAVAVTPAASAIRDAAGNFVANTKITSATTVSGDASAPVMTSVAYSQVGGGTITYVSPYAQVLITSTFNEDMTNTPPTITINAPGTVADITAQNMSRTSATVWTYTWTVINDATVEGTASLTFAGSDLAGNAYVEAGHSIVIDSHAPVVKTFTATSITSNSALLTVTTNENATCKYANSEFDYATSGTLMSTTTGVTTHLQSLSGLSASTNYAYYVRCLDDSGNTMTDSAHVFFTALGDTTAPTISGVATSTMKTTAAISFQSNENGYGKIAYSKSGVTPLATDYISLTAASTTTINLANLECGTAYTYNVYAKDASGNENKLADATFVTAACDSVTLGVTQNKLIKSRATKDGNPANGWHWVLDVTVPTASTTLDMKFSNLTGTGATTINASNIHFYSEQSSAFSSSADMADIIEADAWSTDHLILNDDIDNNSANGRQIQIIIEAGVPSSASDLPYSATYEIEASAPL
jgi:hypothetical protein